MARCRWWIYCTVIFFITPLFVHGQELSSDFIKSIRSEAIPLASNNPSTPDWTPLLPVLKKKKIILLGEFTHGTKEISELHVSLIKFLHHKLGVKTILFESGIGELAYVDLHKETLEPVQMINGFFTNWRSKAFIDLMQYVKSNKMSVGGFDVQRFGGAFKHVLRQAAEMMKIDTSAYHDLEDRFGILVRELGNNKISYDSVRTRTEKLIENYNLLYKNLSVNIIRNNSRVMMFARITVTNRVRYLSYMLEFKQDKNWSKRWAARDSAMADNIRWLAANMYDKPVIVIAHNFHVAKSNPTETVMGQLLEKYKGDESYSIGFFAGGGEYLDNTGKSKKMLVPDSTKLDIKHIIHTMDGDLSFINLATRNSLHPYLNGSIVVNDTFIDLNNRNELNLVDCFDGVIFLRKVSPAEQ